MKEDLNRTFEQIYKKESDAVFRFCLLRVSSREQALDIVQETFLRLWKKMLDEKEIFNSKALIFTIARHLIIDWYRKKKSFSLDILKSGSNESEEGSYDVLDGRTTIANLEIAAEGRYLLEKINELAPSYRDSVYLRFVEDLSPPEIGEIIGISANAASVRINRGLLELKKIAGYNDKNK